MTTIRQRTTKTRIARWGGVVVVTLAVSAAAGCSPAQPATDPTVTVQFRGVEQAKDSFVAGVLYRGAAPIHPDTRVVGGFGVRGPSDRWSDDQVVRRPMPEMDTGRPFPYVTDEPLEVEPGTYALVVYLSRDPLTPFSRWVPAGAFGALSEMWGCQATFTVEQSDVTVNVTEIPRMTGNVPPCS